MFPRIKRAELLACAVAVLLVSATIERPGSEIENVKSTEHTNKLVNETSPYLLQHAHNPVDWYPWSMEALERAKREDKPIFLSIGYSACHWCHVMERESFENEAIAAIMNEHFVCIKVDREERPDLDEIYMNAVQMMTGSGGWPLNVFLTPDLKPFYGGTYFPPENGRGMPAFPRVLLSVAETYREKRQDVERSATNITEAITTALQGPAEAKTDLLDERIIERAANQLRGEFDTQWGGFSIAPKFPPSASISLLLRHHRRTGDAYALDMATTTLDRMAYGGMYDQLGGGFHRYAVDREWLVPHFEKMLYDNAQLAEVYIEAYQLTGKPLYLRIAGETLDYVLREMTDDTGGFHSAQDADSEGEEGKYYVWTLEEVNEILGSEDGALFSRYYGVTDEGNFEGCNILHVPRDPEVFAEQAGVGLEELARRLDGMGRKLLAVRADRVPPGKDDKILADWNGLMISAFARGARVLDSKTYRTAAERAAAFVLGSMRTNGRLQHTYRSGSGTVDALLDDYAFLIMALLDLYEATFDVAWVEEATDLAEEMVRLFWDADGGGFYTTPAGKADVLVRSKGAYDSAVPSGNSVAVHALLRLARLTDKKEYSEKAEKTLQVFSSAMDRSPRAFVRLLGSLDFYLGPRQEVVVVGDSEDAATRRLLELVYRSYLPNTLVAQVDPAADAAVAKAIPLLSGKKLVDGKPAAYVCRGTVCYRPVTSVNQLREKLVQE